MSKMDFKIGEEKEMPTKKVVLYQAQQDFRTMIDLITYDIKQGQIIDKPDVISRLLSVNAPILPMSEERPDIIHCPHCSRKIELSKVPAVKSYLEQHK